MDRQEKTELKEVITEICEELRIKKTKLSFDNSELISETMIAITAQIKKQYM